MLVDNTNEIIDKIKQATKNACNEIGVVGTAEVKANTPVDTGKLRRSYTYNAEDTKVEIGTALDYAKHVEFKPTNAGGRPHFRTSIESQTGEFINIIETHLGGI
ncbi:HK97 gp10 family phage protein [Romboutsia sp. 1001216sp1]|uniref:HK97 gp10 family phage protein n=1 Tax=Romboutsia sp. 1001216sp1 TaxID=2986997 RepID=UPI00232F24BB|nr:HK97 gp10 family phage protein [Romboutsia sp. 1001216sp1]MDB8791951.1 HK97 gp10 family phage protein [Romboutsia sp. 1001216sp1]